MNCPNRHETLGNQNHFECPCPKDCPRHGTCCACVAHHRKHGKLPFCLRDMEKGSKELRMEIALMKRGELDSAAQLATEAFDDYVYMTNYLPEEKERRSIVFSVLRHEYRTNFRRSLFIAGKLDGKIVTTAQLNPPAYRKPSDLMYLLHGWLDVYKAGDRKRIDDWLAMDSAAGKPCHELVNKSPGTWYLSSLTVSPHAQGKGVGKAMLRWVEEYVLAHGGSAVTFFTNSEENFRYYCKRGYEMFDYREFSNDGKTMGSWSVVKKLK